jgi:hypothetical protein
MKCQWVNMEQPPLIKELVRLMIRNHQQTVNFFLETFVSAAFHIFKKDINLYSQFYM